MPKQYVYVNPDTGQLQTATREQLLQLLMTDARRCAHVEHCQYDRTADSPYCLKHFVDQRRERHERFLRTVEGDGRA